jgi:hypothetical protein
MNRKEQGVAGPLLLNSKKIIFYVNRKNILLLFIAPENIRRIFQKDLKTWTFKICLLSVTVKFFTRIIVIILTIELEVANFHFYRPSSLGTITSLVTFFIVRTLSCLY